MAEWSEQAIKLLALWSFDFAFIEDANAGKCYIDDDNEKNIFSTKHDTICFAVPRVIDIIFENNIVSESMRTDKLFANLHIFTL